MRSRLLLLLLLQSIEIGVLNSGGQHFVGATISPGDRSKHQPKQPKRRRGPQEDNVFDRDLIDEEPSAKDILVENAAYCKDTAMRHFNGTVLGYVTAWNSHGYDVAKTFAKKFDIISPVWFQIIKHDEDYMLAGTHDIDAGWVKDVRRKSSKSERSGVKFFPRILFDKFSDQDFSHLLSYAHERAKVNQVIVDACLDNGFDGVVLEFWSHLAGRVDDLFLQRLIIEMSNALQKENFRLIIVIPPMRAEMEELFGAKHLDALYKHVHAFSLMTYDFSSVQRPGANAPLDWVRRSIENLVPVNSHDFKSKRRKILMGLNMYGNDYTPDGGNFIIAGQYLELLKHVKKRLTFDEHDVENFFEIKTNTGRHMVFYPTLFSINERIKLAQEMGVGISIWELGQGLDYFYDLF